MSAIMMELRACCACCSSSRNLRWYAAVARHGIDVEHSLETLLFFASSGRNELGAWFFSMRS